MGTRNEARDLVRKWYVQWSGADIAPTAREIAQAVQIIEQYGSEKTSRLVPFLVEVMRTNWPEAKRFGSCGVYVAEAIELLNERDETSARKKQNDQATLATRKRNDDEKKKQQEKKKQEDEKWESLIETLPEDQRDAMREQIQAARSKPITQPNAVKVLLTSFANSTDLPEDMRV